MKIKLLTLIMALGALFFVGCEENDNVIVEEVVIDVVPASPQNVYSVTGDGAVYIYWNGPYESDIDSYIILRSFEPTTNYQEIATVDAVPNSNLDLVVYEYVDNSAVNGVKYWYAVASVDNAGQVSELSAEDVFDTPRPEGSVELSDYLVSPTSAGFGFSVQARVAYDSPVADVFVDRVDGVYYLNVVDVDTDIQDMGFTGSFDDIGWSPDDGWSLNGWQEIIYGHTYVIWTRDNHYAKLRVTALNANSVSFQWAYQTVSGELELVAPNFEITPKPVHGDGYLSKSAEARIANQ